MDEEQRRDLCFFSLERGKPPDTAHMVLNIVNEVRGGEDLPSEAAEVHNNLWPCHEGAPLQTCRQEEKRATTGVIMV